MRLKYQTEKRWTTRAGLEAKARFVKNVKMGSPRRGFVRATFFVELHGRAKGRWIAFHREHSHDVPIGQHRGRVLECCVGLCERLAERMVSW